MKALTKNDWRKQEYDYTSCPLENNFRPWFWVVYYGKSDGTTMKSFFDKEETAVRFAHGRNQASIAKCYISTWEIAEATNVVKFTPESGELQ